MFERIAKATLKINCGASSGSGFHFLNEELVITNHHVIESHLSTGCSINAVIEDGTIINMQLLKYSPKTQYDYAILKTKEPIPKDRVILHPKVQDYVTRGTEVCFSGYPHGIGDLLVHKAYVSGPYKYIGFYIDGSVNGGNSGGPIIDVSDESVIGIVTQRRFLGAQELQDVSNRAKQLQEHCKKLLVGRGSVNIMGIDFTQLANLMSESFLMSNLIIESNANSGIGIGFHIKFATEDCKKLGY